MKSTKPVVPWSSHSNEGDRQQTRKRIDRIISVVRNATKTTKGWLRWCMVTDACGELLSTGWPLCHCSSWLARRTALSLCNPPFGGGAVGGVGLLFEKWHSGEQEPFCLPCLVVWHLEEQRGGWRLEWLTGTGCSPARISLSWLGCFGHGGFCVGRCLFAEWPSSASSVHLGCFFKTHPSKISVKNHLPFLEPSPRPLQCGIDYSLLLGLALFLLTNSVSTDVPQCNFFVCFRLPENMVP